MDGNLDGHVKTPKQDEQAGKAAQWQQHLSRNKQLSSFLSLFVDLNQLKVAPSTNTFDKQHLLHKKHHLLYK